MGRSELPANHARSRLRMPYRLSLCLGRTSHRTVPAIAASSCQPPRPTNRLLLPLQPTFPRGRRFERPRGISLVGGSILYFLPSSNPLSSYRIIPGAVRSTEYVHHFQVGRW